MWARELQLHSNDILATQVKRFKWQKVPTHIYALKYILGLIPLFYIKIVLYIRVVFVL
jgi:hypothetical protein